jgi:DNA polymerase III subunit gamma/tau
MSYLVFARKWRPLTFDDVVGQEHITETLKKAIEKNRVAHAYIFTGTRGVGKTTTARILARALNCEKGPTATPCGECTSCKDIINGSSFDVLEIDGASNNSVNDIRELRENIGYSSMGGKHRIFVIDEVHMLSNSAFNALLKTLEEPPKNVIFIFATTEPQKIPATIHSRCQRYDFRRIGADHILERLIFICDTEKITYERSALMLVAQKADGSMRDALSLLDQVYSFCHDNLNEKEVRSVLGLVGGEVYTKIMDSIAEKKAAVVLGLIQDVLYQGFDLQEFLLGLQEHLRNLLFARIPDALATRGFDLDKESADALALSAARFTEGDLLRMAEIVRKTEHELKWSAFPRFSAEIMLLKLVFLDSTVSIEHMIKLFGSGGNAADLIPALSAHNDQEVKKKLNSEPSDTSPQIAASLKKNNLNNTISLACLENSPETDDPGSSHDSNVHKSDHGIVHDIDPQTDVANIAEPIPGDFNDVTHSDSPDMPDMQKVWPEFIEMLLRDHQKLGSFLSLAAFAGCSSHTIDLRFSQKFNFQFQELNKKQQRDEIIHLLHSFTQKKFEVRMTLESDANTEDKNYFTQSGMMPLTINDEIEHEPIIQTLLDIFDGEIIE